MTMPSLLDAFDTVAHSEQLLKRLESATAELSKKQEQDISTVQNAQLAIVAVSVGGWFLAHRHGQARGRLNDKAREAA